MSHDILILTAETSNSASTELPQDMSLQWCAPSLRRPVIPDFGTYGAILSAYHFLHIFKSRWYRALFIFHKDRPVHRSVVIPSYYRYSFMGASDLQIGAIWTDPAYRGRGLATVALHKLVAAFFSSDRTLWYLVAADNQPSILLATRAGFMPVGRLKKVSPLAPLPLHHYEVECNGVIES
jgi:RimJ/RimL family protein N-acetyltransferase